MMKGHVSLQAVLSTALTIVGMTGVIFAWTWTQFGNVTAHASDSDQRIAKVEQATTDFDARLSRIESKQDEILTAITSRR